MRVMYTFEYQRSKICTERKTSSNLVPIYFCKASFLALLVGKRAVLHITEPQHVRKTLIFLHSPVLILQKCSNISGTYIPALITYMWQTKLKAMLGITISNEDFYLKSLGKFKRRCKYIWKNQLQIESFNSPSCHIDHYSLCNESK